MNDTQILTVVLAVVPNVLAVLAGILINNSRFTDVNARISDLRAHVDTRFDEMRDTWRAELRRVEEVIDARLKHLEERR
jgi:hypothetical protein